MSMRKEHTSTKLDLCPGMVGRVSPAVRLLYPLNFTAASDRGHFLHSAASLV
jgi:hypothetical protein